MDIFFHCDKCGHGIAIDDSCAGMVMKCSHCAAGVTIPSSDDHAQIEVAPATSTATATATMPAAAAVASPTTTCPFCVESLHKGRTACSVCGNPLPTHGHARRHVRVTWLGVADVTLVVLILTVGLFTVTKWKSRQGGAFMQAASMATASFSIPHDDTQARGRPELISAASTVMTALHEVQLAIKADADRDKYVEKLGGVTSRLDELLRVADESGLYKADSQVREFCTKTSSIFLGYNKALESWDLELLLRANKEATKLAHETIVETSTDQAAIDKSLKDTTAKLNDLTTQVMKALEGRYDLWLNSEKETQAAAEILVRMRN